MQPTHINAYREEVSAAEQAVVEANGRLSAAKAALKAHPDYEAPKGEVKANANAVKAPARRRFRPSRAKK